MGWMELLLVGVIALIVVGPKDLPVMFQALGKMTAKVRRMAREFQTAMSDAADATGVADIAKDLKGLTSAKSLGIDKLKEAADSFDKWQPTMDKPRGGGADDKPKVGPQTEKLAKKRAKDAKKIREKTADVAQARLDREAAAKAKPKAKPTTKAKVKPTAKTKPKPAAKTKPKPTAKTEPKPTAKPKPKPAAAAKPTPRTKPAAKPRAKVKPASKAKT